MWIVLVASLISLSYGKHIVDELYTSASISAPPSLKDVEFQQYDVHNRSGLEPRAFVGMPPPADSPYLGSPPTHAALEHPREPIRDERSSGTTESSGLIRWTRATTSRYDKESGEWSLASQKRRREGSSELYSTERSYITSKSDSEETYTTEKSFRANDPFHNTDNFLAEDTGVGRISQSEKWCKTYNAHCKSEENKRGLITKITGGVPARSREHPHMAMIGYGLRNNKEWLCGGSLVSSRWILSAAHCAAIINVGPARWARLGELDISTARDDAQPQEREIVQRIVHPGYKEPQVYNDIALFKLDRDVEFNAWISPVCLDGRRSQSTNVATVIGWGRTNFVSETSPVLMKVDVTIFNSSYCKTTVDRISGATKMPRGYDTSSMICAGEKQGGKDACQGDSGGPLVVTSSDCPKLQVGITSVGRECGLPDSPGVYTRVSNYIAWLEDNIWR